MGHTTESDQPPGKALPAEKKILRRPSEFGKKGTKTEDGHEIKDDY